MSAASDLPQAALFEMHPLPARSQVQVATVQGRQPEAHYASHESRLFATAPAIEVLAILAVDTKRHISCCQENLALG